MLRLSVIAFALLGCFAAPAMAQNYVGISGGVMNYEDTGAKLETQGFALTAAGQFDPILAAELTYSTLAQVTANNEDTQGTLLVLSGVVRSPGEGFEPFLRLGIARSDVEMTGYDRSQEGFVFGLGADFALNYNAAIRVEYVEGELDSAEFDSFKIGSIYRF